MTSTRQPWPSANRVYIRNSSPAKSAASSPPVPARISSMTFFSSFGSFGSSSTLISRLERVAAGLERAQFLLRQLAHVGVAAAGQLLRVHDLGEHVLELAEASPRAARSRPAPWRACGTGTGRPAPPGRPACRSGRCIALRRTSVCRSSTHSVGKRLAAAIPPTPAAGRPPRRPSSSLAVILAKSALTATDTDRRVRGDGRELRRPGPARRPPRSQGPRPPAPAPRRRRGRAGGRTAGSSRA